MKIKCNGISKEKFLNYNFLPGREKKLVSISMTVEMNVLYLGRGWNTRAWDLLERKMMRKRSVKSLATNVSREAVRKSKENEEIGLD